MSAICGSGLFTLNAEVGKGLPLWLPHGTVVREELEKLAKELEFKAGFERVATPHLARGVRDASRRKIPNIVVVGQREQMDGTVPLRTLGHKTPLTFRVDAFERQLLRAIAERRRDSIGPEMA